MDHKNQNFLVSHVTVLKADEVLPRMLKALKIIGPLISAPSKELS